MKLKVLNWNQWASKNVEAFDDLADEMVEQAYDVVVLFEVDQDETQAEAILNEWYCPANETIIRKNNIASELAELLAAQDVEYYWTWGQGRAILSKEPILPNAQKFEAEQLLIGISAVAEELMQIVIGTTEQLSAQWLRQEAEQPSYPLMVLEEANEDATNVSHLSETLVSINDNQPYMIWMSEQLVE